LLLTQVRWLPWQGASVSEFAHGGEIDRKYAIAPLLQKLMTAFHLWIFKYGTSNMEPKSCAQ